MKKKYFTREERLEAKRNHNNAYRKRNIEKGKCMDCGSTNLYKGMVRCFKHHEDMLIRSRRIAFEKRNIVLDYYGGKCACCGESNREFLAIDHINKDGAEERKIRKKRNIAVSIISQGFPKDKYRVLCHNCNMSLGIYDYCPHQLPNEEEY